MRIVIKATNLRLTSILRVYIERKIDKLERFANSFSDGVICRVEVGKTTTHHQSGRIYRAEINCSVPGLKSKLFRAESEHWDLRAAIDQALDEITRQFREFRDKLSAKYIKGAREMKRRIRESQ